MLYELWYWCRVQCLRIWRHWAVLYCLRMRWEMCPEASLVGRGHLQSPQPTLSRESCCYMLRAGAFYYLHRSQIYEIVCILYMSLPLQVLKIGIFYIIFHSHCLWFCRSLDFWWQVTDVTKLNLPITMKLSQNWWMQKFNCYFNCCFFVINCWDRQELVQLSQETLGAALTSTARYSCSSQVCPGQIGSWMTDDRELSIKRQGRGTKSNWYC